MMALADHVSDSESSEEPPASIPDDNDIELHQTSPILFPRFRASSKTSPESSLHHRQSESEDELAKPNLEIKLPAPIRPWEYTKFPPSTTVEKILAEIGKPRGEVWYRIEYEDGLEEDVS